MRPTQLVSVYLNEENVASGGGGGGTAVKTGEDIPLFYDGLVAAGNLGVQRIELGGAVWVKLFFDVQLPGATNEAGVNLFWGPSPILTGLNAPFNTLVMFTGNDSGYAVYNYRVGFDADGSGAGTITRMAGSDDSTSTAQTVIVLMN